MLLGNCCGAVLVELGLVAFRQFLDRVVNLGELAGKDDLLETRMGIGERTVFIQRAAEERRFLRHEAKMTVSAL